MQITEVLEGDITLSYFFVFFIFSPVMVQRRRQLKGEGFKGCVGNLISFIHLEINRFLS
jgi:hypothetical protein